MSPQSPTPPAPQPAEVTALLAAWSGGENQALEQLLPLVYGELRGIAAQLFRRERNDHTLQPTAVVHEAFLKLVRGVEVGFRDRAHFFAVASQAMRQILVDHARARVTAKRGGGATRLELRDVADQVQGASVVDVLAVDEALARLSALDPEQGRLVELRFFGGLTHEEAAEVLGVSVPTVKRDWRSARAFLVQELGR